MSSSEEVAYPILRKHDVDYVLVIFGGLLGYSGDDINKFLWMVRIAQGVWPEEIQEPNYFTQQGEYKVDAQASPAMKNSLMYKMSYYRCVALFSLYSCILFSLFSAFPVPASLISLEDRKQLTGSEDNRCLNQARLWII